MEFIKPNITDVEYQQLVIDTIGFYYPHTKHDIIVCLEDNKTVAVFNYFEFLPGTMFLHYTWYDKEYKEKIRKVKYWLGFCEHVKAMGYRKILGIIDSKNTPALIWALKTGWEIIGSRQDINQGILVDVMKEL